MDSFQHTLNKCGGGGGAMVSAMTRCQGSPGVSLGIVEKRRPEILLNLYNTCLVAGIFSKDWTTARLILIDKGKGGDLDSPSSYRPLSLLNTLGKLCELLLRPRIQQAVRDAGGLTTDSTDSDKDGRR